MTKNYSAPTNINEEQQRHTSNNTYKHNLEHTHIRYGIITNVNESNMVQVTLLDNNGLPSNSGPIVQGVHLPLTTQLSTILFLFGPLRKGLLCKVSWRGQIDPNNTCMIEIVGDEEHSFLKKEPQPTEVAVGPWKIFSGGMGI